MEFGLQVPHVIRGVLHSFRGPNSNHMEASVRLRTSAREKKGHIPIGCIRAGNGVSWWKKITNRSKWESQHSLSTNIFTCINIHTHVRTRGHIQIYMHIHKYTHRLWNIHLGLQKLFAWHDGRMSSRLCNIAPILHWQAYIYFAVPNWLCSAELHLWIIWHISCYFFDRSTQRKFQGTFLLTSRNINIWINCRFGSPHMDALQQECVCVYTTAWMCVCGCVFCMCVCVCVWVKGMGRGLFHSVTTVLSPWARRQKSVCSISLGGSSTEWHVKHTSPSTWWSLLLSNDKKPLCRLAFFPLRKRGGDGWAPIKESWMLFHRMTGLSVHKYFSSRKMYASELFFFSSPLFKVDLTW